MIFGALTLAATTPLLGTSSALLATSAVQLQNQSQETTEDQKAKHGTGRAANGSANGNGHAIKTEKCHLLARASPRMSALRQQQVENKILVLKDKQLFLVSQTDMSNYHPLTGYFLPFPDRGYDGLVTTINPERMLNWVYVDKDTYQLKHGVRVESEKNLVGPFDLKSANGELRLIFDRWEGFIAVQETDDMFSLYFDKDDSGLSSLAGDKVVIEIELIRVGLEGVTGHGLGGGNS